jgi:two-component system, LuxR family, sensor kinase FixL
MNQGILATTKSTLARSLARLRQGEARRDIIVLGGILTIAIFAVDLVLPLGIAGGVPYIAPVFLAMWLPDRRLIVGVAAVCTVLAAAGLWLSPLGVELSVAIPNRLLAIAAIWTVALLAMQRKGFEAALAEAEATNSAVLATTADGILSLDARGFIESTNPAAERIFGYHEAELVHRHFTGLLSEEDAALFDRDPKEFLRPDDRLITHEMIGARRDARHIPIEVVLAPVMHEDGLRYTVTVRDVSERRMLEQYLLRRSEAQRRAIGETLHEEVGQALTGLSLISRQLARRLAHHDAAGAREASDLATLLHDLDRQALKLFEAVSPLEVNGGLPAALCDLVRSTSREHDAACAVTEDLPLEPMDKFTARQLYDIVQDLVQEGLKDGHVRSVTLHIGHGGDGRTLALRFQARNGHLGHGWPDLLHHLRYRAKLVGARLETTTPTEGEMLVTCSWSARFEMAG